MFVFEGAVALGNFRNLDLYHQGYYAVRVRISSGIGVSLAYASWPVDVNSLLIDDTFTSPPVVVRYVEEVVCLNCGCQFRFDSRNDEAILEVDLLFKDFTNSRDSIPPLSIFQVVDSIQFKIQSLTSSPMIEYAPLVFSGKYACTVDALLLTMLFSERPAMTTTIVADTWQGLTVVEKACGCPTPEELVITQASLFERWIALLAHLTQPKNLIHIMRDRRAVQKQAEIDLQRSWIIRETWLAGDLTAVGERDVSRTHSRVVLALEESNEMPYMTSRLRIVNLTNAYHDSIYPVVFDQRYHSGSSSGSSSPPKSVSSEDVHVLVLVHGLQGSSYDLRPLRTALQVTHPDLIFLASQSNQDCTDDDISIMGKRLGAEVNKFLKQHDQHLSRLSFVGFSLGGLVIRAALPYLQKYTDRLYTLLTLSTPHMGYVGNSSRLVEGGLWLLQRWNAEATALRQLTHGDSDREDTTYLMTLARQQGLEKFRYIVLASSAQDSYAPFESARIEITPKADSLSIQYMARKLLSDVKSDSLIRLDVHFELTERSIDTFIGRAAHIQFLENRKLCHILSYSYGFLFN